MRERMHECTNECTTQVRLVHSRTNVFRYDENITFVKRELLPGIEALRDHKARRVGGDWPESFHITVSFASGTPAVSHLVS